MFGEVPFATLPLATIVGPGTNVAVTGSFLLTISLGCFYVYAWSTMPDGSGSWTLISPPTSNWIDVGGASNTWGEPSC